ncbi:unnamed protein product [Linum trigynum]|uniref:Uncharacterized protein n=1 Tax=Linum trigynum TaxID=586398 RepID=A0AAV2G6V4_9ROSI
MQNSTSQPAQSQARNVPLTLTHPDNSKNSKFKHPSLIDSIPLVVNLENRSSKCFIPVMNFPIVALSESSSRGQAMSAMRYSFGTFPRRWEED